MQYTVATLQYHSYKMWYILSAIIVFIFSFQTQASRLEPKPFFKISQANVTNQPSTPSTNNCRSVQFSNEQIDMPYVGGNGMSENGSWKYCYGSAGLQACLNWCNNNGDCAGVTQDDYNGSDFYFPVTTISWSQVRCVDGLSFWEKDCHCSVD